MNKILYLIVVVSSLLAAQDFGYEYLMLSEYRAIGASYTQQKFLPRSSNTLSDSIAIRFQQLCRSLNSARITDG